MADTRAVLEAVQRVDGFVRQTDRQVAALVSQVRQLEQDAARRDEELAALHSEIETMRRESAERVAFAAGKEAAEAAAAAVGAATPLAVPVVVGAQQGQGATPATTPAPKGESLAEKLIGYAVKALVGALLAAMGVGGAWQAMHGGNDASNASGSHGKPSPVAPGDSATGAARLPAARRDDRNVAPHLRHVGAHAPQDSPRVR